MNKFESNQPISERKRDSGLMRAPGQTPEKENEVLDVFARIFSGKREDFQRIEREKTENELVLIGKINEKMRGFVERYGGKFIEVSQDNIHFVDNTKLLKSDWQDIRRNFDIKGMRGVYGFNRQGVVNFLFRGEDDFSFACVLAHELFHFNSFQSVNIDWENDEKKEGSVHRRRIGMEIASKIDDDEEILYFKDLNEALTEELVRRFVYEYLVDFPELQEGIEMREHYKKNGRNRALNDISVTNRKKKQGYWIAQAKESPAYEKERVFLIKLVNEIYAKNQEKFSSKEDVFEFFFNAYFTGKIIKLANLIEDTFGKGAFRKLAEETGTIDKAWKMSIKIADKDEE